MSEQIQVTTTTSPQKPRDSLTTQENQNEDSCKTQKSSSSVPQREVKFPIRLHQMLVEVEANGLTDIVSWQPDGTSFKVHQQNAFVEKVLPRYFSQTKYRSFQRQLNHYGFERTQKGALEGSYSHPRFVKGRPERSEDMKRIKRAKVTMPNTPSQTGTKKIVNVVSPVKPYPGVQLMSLPWYPASSVPSPTSVTAYTQHQFDASSGSFTNSADPSSTPSMSQSHCLEGKPLVSVPVSQQLDTIDDLCRLLDDDNGESDFGNLELSYNQDFKDADETLSASKHDFAPPFAPFDSTSAFDCYSHHYRPRMIHSTSSDRGTVAIDYDESFYFGPSFTNEKDSGFYPSYQASQMIGH